MATRRLAVVLAMAAPLMACTNAADLLGMSPLTNLMMSEMNTEFGQASAAPVTPVASLPSGTSSYVGGFGATTAGDHVGAIYALLDMDVDFDSGVVDGTLSRLTLIDDFSTVEGALGGTLTIAGTTTAGAVAANATGPLTGGSTPLSGAGAATFVLAGSARTDTAPADALYGVVTGNITGDFNITLSDGEFYGREN